MVEYYIKSQHDIWLTKCVYTIRNVHPPGGATTHRCIRRFAQIFILDILTNINSI